MFKTDSSGTHHKSEHLLLGESKEISSVRDEIEKIAKSDATTLISGESGTGKELAARTIHRMSRRGNGPFVAINCSAIPETLIEREIFGHEKGAFTGASEKSAGCFELAQQGTLFLDEIGEMPIATQAKLLRVLQDHKVRRLGGKVEIPFDVRVLAATNKIPEMAVDKGELREDLYYRLNVCNIYIPPLREHPDDIPLLAEHFLAEFNLEKFKGNLASYHRFSPAAMQLLQKYHWRGNVRELSNAIKRAVVGSDTEVIEPSLLPNLTTGGIGQRLRTTTSQIISTITNITKHGSWKGKWDDQIPILLGYLCIYRESGGSSNERLDAAARATGYMKHSTFRSKGKPIIKDILTEWSAAPERMFQPSFPQGVPPPTGGTGGRSYNYPGCVFEFRSELLELECLVPDEIPVITQLSYFSSTGEIRLIRALPGRLRDGMVTDLVQRETARGKNVLAAYYLESVGKDSESESDTAISLCTVIASKIGKPVTYGMLPSLFSDDRLLLVINGFCPTGANADSEWSNLLRLLKRLQSVTSSVLFQAANPCHDPVLATASTAVWFTYSSPMPVPGEIPARTIMELRPCCRRLLERGEFDLSDTCVKELIESKILRMEGSNIVPPPSLMHFLRKGGASG
jgi:hypothetical protein